MSDKAQQESQIILQQLGGNRFAVMTGAKNFGYSVDNKGCTRLTFKIGRNARSINYVSITLNGLDLYDMQFLSVRFRKGELIHKVVESFNDVYNDQLRELFEKATGLYTSL